MSAEKRMYNAINSESLTSALLAVHLTGDVHRPQEGQGARGYPSVEIAATPYTYIYSLKYMKIIYVIISQS